MQLAKIQEETGPVRKDDTEIHQSMEKFSANGNCWVSVSRPYAQNAG
jgi:hypothetical protein